MIDEKIFRNDAKSIVDLSFDRKLFKNEITRDDMEGFEDLICFLLSSRYESYLKTEKLLQSLLKTSKSNTPQND